jgi:hypothetical protein
MQTLQNIIHHVAVNPLKPSLGTIAAGGLSLLTLSGRLEAYMTPDDVSMLVWKCGTNMHFLGKYGMDVSSEGM